MAVDIPKRSGTKDAPTAAFASICLRDLKRISGRKESAAAGRFDKTASSQLRYLEHQWSGGLCLLGGSGLASCLGRVETFAVVLVPLPHRECLEFGEDCSDACIPFGKAQL